MNSSGKDEGGNAMTSCGIPRLKALVTEAAQISPRRGDAPMHHWTRRKLAKGKHSLPVLSEGVDLIGIP